MIKPEGIPIADLNNVVMALDANIGPLSGLGQQFTDVGNNTHSAFQGLNAVYHAPEREVLVNSTQKIRKNLTEFGPSLPAMSRHLSNLANDVRGKVGTLEDIRRQAYEWHRKKDGNPEWQNDQYMIDWNNRMVNDVHKIVKEDIPNLCFACANAIVALHGGKPWDPKTGLREGQEAPKDEKQEGDPPPEPWGTTEERDKPLWQDIVEFPGNLVMGVLTVVGETVEGLLTLIPVLPALGSIRGLRDWAKDTFGYDIPTWEDAGNAWKGLGTLAVNLATATPQLLWWGFDKITGQDTRPQFVKDLGEQGVGMLKGMVAWDEWAKNPGKAFGMALTNIVSTVGTFGAGAAIKGAAMAGKLGMMSGTVAKVAKVADFAKGVKIGIHDATLGAVMKIPKVGPVVEGIAKIPIVGDNFTMHGPPKVDVPSGNTPEVSSTPSHAHVDAPSARADVPAVHTPSVDTPTVHTPGGEAPSVHTPGSDAPGTHSPSPASHAGPGAPTPSSHGDPGTPQSHTGPGTTAPGSHSDPGTTPVSHSDPGTTPVSHSDPGMTPGSHAEPGTTAPGTTPGSHSEPGTSPASHAEPGSTTSGSRTEPTSTTPGSRTEPSSAPGSHAEPGSTTPGSRAEPGTTTPGSHAEPRSTTPGSRTEPGSTPGARANEPQTLTHEPGSTRAPESHTPDSTHTPEPNTTHAPESHTPSTTHGPNTPGTMHTPEPRTPSAHVPGATPRTPETPGTRTPEPRQPESPPARPEETAPAARAADPAVTPVMPIHPGAHPSSPYGTPHTPGRGMEGTPGGRRTPEPSAARGRGEDPLYPNGRNDHWNPETPDYRDPSGTTQHAARQADSTPSWHERANDPNRPAWHDPNYDPNRPPVHDPHTVDRTHPGEHEFGPQSVEHYERTPISREHQPHDPNAPRDAANDPKYDDPNRRQVEIDAMKPDHLRPEPGKPRSQVDPAQHIPADPRDPRAGELTDSVGDPPVSNVPDWMGKVNPDHDLSQQYRMNCPDIARNVADILNGDTPRLASGNKLARGEDPEGTLEWMDLKDFKPEHKMSAPEGPHNPADFTNAAYKRVHDALDGKPPGTHANIFVTWKDGLGGHVFNAFVGPDHKVHWLDAQPPGGKLVESRPHGWNEPHPQNPHRYDDGTPKDISSIQFATREPGGLWDGVPRDAHTPPASQLRHQRPMSPIHGSDPSVPHHDGSDPSVPHHDGSETPEPPDTPEAHSAPETPNTPETPATPEIPRAPESPSIAERLNRTDPGTPETPQVPRTPEAPTSIADRLAGRTSSETPSPTHQPASEGIHRREWQQPETTAPHAPEQHVPEQSVPHSPQPHFPEQHAPHAPEQHVPGTPGHQPEQHVPGAPEHRAAGSHEAPTGSHTPETPHAPEAPQPTHAPGPPHAPEVSQAPETPQVAERPPVSGRPEDYGFDSAHEPRREITPEAKEKYLEEYRAAAEKWGPETLDDLESYVGSAANRVNSWLRNPAKGRAAIEQQMPHLVEWMDRMDNMLREAPLSAEPRTLYRGLQAPEHIRTEAAFRQWLGETFKLGEDFHTPGFSHTSIAPEIGAAFAKGQGRPFGVVMEVKTRQGVPVGYGRHAEFHEGEYALPTGFKPRIVGISEGVPFQRMGERGLIEERNVVIHVVDDSTPGGGLPPHHTPEPTPAPTTHTPSQPEPRAPHQPETYHQPEQPYIPEAQYQPRQPEVQYPPHQQDPYNQYPPHQPEGQYPPQQPHYGEPQQPHYGEPQQPQYRQPEGQYPPHQQQPHYGEPQQPGSFGPTGHQPEGQYPPPHYGEQTPYGQPHQPGEQYHPQQPHGQYPPHQPRGQYPQHPVQGHYPPHQPQGQYPPHPPEGQYPPHQQQPRYGEPQQPQYRQPEGQYPPHHPQSQYPRHPQQPHYGEPQQPHYGEPQQPGSFGPTGHQPEGQYPPPHYGEQPPYGQPHPQSPQPQGQYPPNQQEGQYPPQQHPQYGQPQQYHPQQPPHGHYPPHQPPQYGGQPEQPRFGSAEHQAGGQDWRPGDAGFGVSDKPGFDPAFHHKALGDQFAPGVHDPDGKFVPKEREIADRLEQEGWRVDARPDDHTKDHLKNPESMVRKDPGDEGLITEFKTLNSGGKNAARRNINEASDQVPPDGEVVIDGRNVGLTREIADRAFGGAANQPGKTVAAKVHIILGDGSLVTYAKES